MASDRAARRSRNTSTSSRKQGSSERGVRAASSSTTSTRRRSARSRSAGRRRTERRVPMRIVVTSVMVDDQSKAQSFYTSVLGFVTKNDIPLGEDRWLTVVSPEAPDGTELLLEPDSHPAAKPWKAALVEDGIPATSFGVTDIRAEYERLRGLGVQFTQEPTEMGPVTTAVFDDTCGNLIQIAQPAEPGGSEP